MKGKATLTLALAGVNRPGELTVSLNGKPLGSVMCPRGDSSIHRSGIYGNFQEGFIAFDASHLRKGKNVLALDIHPEEQWESRSNHSRHGVMYDFLQLEVE